MSLRIVFTPNAWQDYDGWLRRDMKTARRISKLIIDVQRDPQGTGIGKPEMLKGPLSGWSSRRVNEAQADLPSPRQRLGDCCLPRPLPRQVTASAGRPGIADPRPGPRASGDHTACRRPRRLPGR
ncbi:type II toxin-antitoxin system YoeB family toxin [Micromonosporaceae bacterium Da 78-11]